MARNGNGSREREEVDDKLSWSSELSSNSCVSGNPFDLALLDHKDEDASARPELTRSEHRKEVHEAQDDARTVSALKMRRHPSQKRFVTTEEINSLRDALHLLGPNTEFISVAATEHACACGATFDNIQELVT